MSPSLAGPRDRARAEALRRKIVYHERKYYVDNDPQISDAEFDRLVGELREPRGPLPRSRDARVADPAGRRKAARGLPLRRPPDADAQHRQRLRRGRDPRVRGARPQAPARTGRSPTRPSSRSTASASPSSTGTASSPGRVTRGDGVRGDDVSGNVKTIRALPLVIEAAGRGRGPRRGLPALRLLPQDQRGARGSGRSRSSPTPATRRPAPIRLLDPRIVAVPQPQRLPLLPRHRREGGGEPVGRPAEAPGARLPDQPPLALLPDARRRPGLLPGMEREAGQPRLRRRRHRRQGRRERTSGGSSGRRPSRRAGPSPTSSRPGRRRPASTTSSSRSAAPAP